MIAGQSPDPRWQETQEAVKLHQIVTNGRSALIVGICEGGTAIAQVKPPVD